MGHKAGIEGREMIGLCRGVELTGVVEVVLSGGIWEVSDG